MSTITTPKLPPDPRLLRVAEAAAYIGSTIWFIRSLVWERRIPFLKLGKRLLFDKADLDSFITAQKEAAR